jgi:putative chitinase
MITPELLQKLGITKESSEWADILNNLLPKYQIDSPQRIAAFIAQCSHESGHFEKLIENLNYGAKGLVMTWPKRFTTPELANKYARQPEAIANFVYSNRLGNGDELSGDGWKYRGRGIIQLTGKYNYQKFADSVGMNLEQVIDYLETKQGATEAACLFWKNNNLNRYADNGDIRGMTKVINGGFLGLSEREENYKKALTILGSQ